MDRKDIFMSGFKSKIGYSFTYKDLNELEAIINFYEQQVKKQKKVIDKINHILNNQINYREFVDIVNAIEDVVKEVE